MGWNVSNEITVLEGSGGLKRSLLFLYAITPADVNGVTQVPTPSDGLSPIAATILVAGEKAALDNGSAAFEVVSMEVVEGKTNAELKVEAQAFYAIKKVDYLIRHGRKYDDLTGVRFNEV